MPSRRILVTGLSTYWGGRPTQDWMYTTAYAAGAEWNETYWDHPRFNELLVAARVELDPALCVDGAFNQTQGYAATPMAQKPATAPRMA